jgi:hypothetical protein
MKITRAKLVKIIKEELDDLDPTLMPQPLDPSAGKPASFTKSPGEPETKYDADPTVQDLMFKIEKLMSRVEKLERMLKAKPSPSQEDTYGDTEYAEIP